MKVYKKLGTVFIISVLLLSSMLIVNADNSEKNKKNQILWNPVNVNTAICTATSNQEYPQIISDGFGGAIITWMDSRGSDYDIYAQRIDNTGAVLWTPNGVVICSAVDGQWYPQITSDGSDGAIITWQDYRPPTDTDIYAQRIDRNGNIKWANNGVAICTATGSQQRPQIISNGSGDAIITWHDKRNVDWDIYGQYINNTGNVQWTIDGIEICTSTNDQLEPKLISDGLGGAIITWKDFRNGGSNLDIYAQHVNSNGIVNWGTNGKAICDETSSSQYDPEICCSNNGGAIMVWRDYRDGTSSTDIYAQKTIVELPLYFILFIILSNPENEITIDSLDSHVNNIVLIIIIEMIFIAVITIIFAKRKK